MADEGGAIKRLLRIVKNSEFKNYYREKKSLIAFKILPWFKRLNLLKILVAWIPERRLRFQLYGVGL